MDDPKYKIRKGTLFNRRMLADEVWLQRSEAVCREALAFLRLREISCFHLFLPIRRNREVDTWPLLHQAFVEARQIILSATDFEEELMHHYVYQDGLRIKEDALGIPTPLNGEPANLEKLQLVFLPMLAGDKAGNRIGYGKGYYDRLLSTMPADLLKVGLSLNPLFDHFPFAEAHDVPLDAVITPWGVVDCGLLTNFKKA